jgi:hypothetical protein
MSDKKVIRPIALAVGAALAGSFALGTSIASADSVDSPFEISALRSGYLLGEEGTCGGDKAGNETEGSCGGDKEGDAGDKDSEAHCGGDKDGEAHCGGAKDGEGTCGDEKEGEGSCGGEKEAEGSCGEGSCGGSI